MPFVRLAREHNIEYIGSTDWRVKKPHVYFHKDKPHLKIVIPNNWVLESDRLETMLDRPNDVALYSSIAESSLEKARRFHKEKLIPRITSGFLPHTLRQNELKEYYDYFETIITSVVFAYSSIEAFVNMSIPHDYTLTRIEKSGEETILNKSEIEKQCSLKVKLKTILPNILSCDSPSQKKWWEIFTKLETLRNEIIHSKESKSEERYSKLLSAKIFRIVEIHKTVIEFFGQYIYESNSNLLDEYPNGFGYDTYKVKTMTEQNFQNSINVLNG
jgi:hypothetical protein